MIHKFTGNLTLRTLILLPLNWKIALRPSRCGWEITNLKLTSDKMEFIVNGDDQIRSSMRSSFPVSFLGNIMKPSESVKNIGVFLDADNSMQRHVSNLCPHK